MTALPLSSRVLDALWRALAYCLHPRVIGWSLLPLLLAVLASLGLGYFLWEPAVGAVRAWLEQWQLVSAALQWLDGVGASGLRATLAPLVVMALALPLVMALSLLLVATLMTPALAGLVAERRFPQLEKRRGGTLWGGFFTALSGTLLALVLLLLSLPFWLIPPVVLVLPPLVWGWLTQRVFAYDVLAVHASEAEREQLGRTQRPALWGMGIACGYLGAAPSLLFAFGPMSLALAPLLLPLAIWLYTLVFALGALWFAHYLLAALDAQRRTMPTPPTLDLPQDPS